MRSRRPLHTLCIALVVAVLSSGCAAPLLLGGVPVSTDPDPNPGRVYRTPQWDARTMARAEAITSVVRAALVCIPMFPADSWCSNFDAARVWVRLDP